MIKISVVLLFGLFSLQKIHAQSASELARRKVNSPPAVTSSLPHCVSDAAEVAKIKNIINANLKNKFKYDGYRQALRSDSDIQLAARLAYSETRAARCPELNTLIAPLIVNSIVNRIEKRKGDVRSVVFQRDQFSSSLNIYEESHYLEFLCPQDQQLWSSILAQTTAAMTDPKAQRSLAADSVNYFLYQHSPRWTKEPWVLKEDLPKTERPIRSCVRFFQNPTWK